MIAIRSVAIAGSNAQSHGRGNAGIARLNFRLAVFITQVLKIDLPSKRQTGGHAVHEGASLGIESRATVQPALRSGNEKDAQGSISCHCWPLHNGCAALSLRRRCSKMLSKERVYVPQPSCSYHGHQLQLRQLVPAVCAPSISDRKMPGHAL